MPPVIEESARARLISDAPDEGGQIPVALRYDATADPPTVHVTFPGGTDWVLGRDLLEDGLRTPVERGGVRVWPCGRAQLVVELHSPDGVEVIELDNGPLIRFLDRTYKESVSV
ncbi:SsgA family sporulation/cell division regulator [Streptomyces sp. DT24]|uniref:SsgA family sporulation/cell division regulator n=1 Tax=Streptomyces sp. DT24 TaxID=3416520 RepID=UPI003CFA96AD